MTTQLSLPQDDPDKDARRTELDEQSKLYRYNRDHLGVLFADAVPSGEHYDLRYGANLAKVAKDILENRASQKTVSWPAVTGALGDVLALPPIDVVAALGRHLVATAGHLPTSRPTDVNGYDDLIATVPRPLSMGKLDDDAFFAWQQVAGATPITLRGIAALPDNLPVDAAMYARAVQGADSLDAAVAEGRLFLADYALWNGMVTGTTAGQQKYLWAPLALFAQVQGKGLRPVAIQTGQRPGRDHPIWTPSDGVGWRMAKTAVSTADMNVNGVVAHFGLCHAVAEAFICVSHRQLSPRHPLLHLLAPHFHYTLAVNETARTSLVNPGGTQETLQSGTLEANFEVIVRELAAIPFDSAGARADFRRRKVDDVARLPSYPFRDDGIPIADAIDGWAGAYLALYYAGDEAVRADTELRAWAEELAGPGGFNSMPRLDTVASLTRFVADMLWRITGYHAVINYAGWDYAAWAPGMPSAAFGPGPDGGVAAEAWRAMLPPLSVANQMLELMFTLANTRLNKLGDYPDGHFTDPRVLPLVAKLQADLRAVEAGTKARDATRPWGFPFLHPSNVPLSIHV